MAARLDSSRSTVWLEGLQRPIRCVTDVVLGFLLPGVAQPHKKLPGFGDLA